MKRKGGIRTCRICGKQTVVSAVLGACRNCILDNFPAVETRIARAHELTRSSFGLSAKSAKDGVQCAQCVNMCRPRDGKHGFCGVRRAEGASVVPAVDGAVLEWYYDPLPTNCVADFVCPASTGRGYPKYASTRGPEHGYKNLAVFYGACNFSCLFCQNWHYRELTRAMAPVVTAEQLAAKVDKKTACVCYFGGDPAPQIGHSIETSEMIGDSGGPVRICYETNGSMNRKYLRRIADLSYKSGGCIKFDLKTWNPSLSRALCGTDNRWTLNNFRWLADYQSAREDRGFPLLVASTLMVPGYVEKEEIAELSSFIASLDREIPYSLLAFSPKFEMTDLPPVSEKMSEECLDAAKAAGLKTVRVGNEHLVA